MTKKDSLNASILHRSPHSSGRNSIVLFSEKSQYELLDEVLISECEKINGIQKTIVTTQVKVIAIKQLASVLHVIDRIG